MPTYKGAHAGNRTELVNCDLEFRKPNFVFYGNYQ